MVNCESGSAASGISDGPLNQYCKFMRPASMLPSCPKFATLHAHISQDLTQSPPASINVLSCCRGEEKSIDVSIPDKECDERVDVALPAAAGLVLVLQVDHWRVLDIQRRGLCDQVLPRLCHLLWRSRGCRCRGAALRLQGKLRAHKIVERHIINGRHLCTALLPF